MDEVGELLRYAWQTDNAYTIAIQRYGQCGHGGGFANVVEPGDRVLVAVNGYFGRRMVDMAGRYGVTCVVWRPSGAGRFASKDSSRAGNPPAASAGAGAG